MALAPKPAAGMPEQLHQGLTFTSWTGPIAIHHQVEVATPNCLRLLLVKELTGFTNGTGEKAGYNLVWKEYQCRR